MARRSQDPRKGCPSVVRSLTGQNLRRGHHCRLEACARGLQRRGGGDDRLATTDVALYQPLHYPCAGQIGADVANRLVLGVRQGERQARERPRSTPHRRRVNCPAGSPPLACAGSGRSEKEQLIERESTRRISQQLPSRRGSAADRSRTATRSGPCSARIGCGSDRPGSGGSHRSPGESAGGAAFGRVPASARRPGSAGSGQARPNLRSSHSGPVSETPPRNSSSGPWTTISSPTASCSGDVRIEPGDTRPTGAIRDPSFDPVALLPRNGLQLGNSSGQRDTARRRTCARPGRSAAGREKSIWWRGRVAKQIFDRLDPELGEFGGDRRADAAKDHYGFVGPANHERGLAANVSVREGRQDSCRWDQRAGRPAEAGGAIAFSRSAVRLSCSCRSGIELTAVLAGARSD